MVSFFTLESKRRESIMEKQVIKTSDAPDVVLPLSQAIQLGNLVFTSGATARDPKTRELIGGDIEIQTERIILNLKAILEAAGSSLDKVVKVTVFLTDIRDFEGMNNIYRKFFPKDPPARSTVEVSKLAVDARVEIEMIAGV
jgi:2-iminobutanoate/2-iminopropanoate deaminase